MFEIIKIPDTIGDLIEQLGTKPKFWFKGKDYTREELFEADAVEAGGGEIVLVDLVKGRSTTNIIRKMRE